MKQFQADPSKVRVAIRRKGGIWEATVQSRFPNTYEVYYHRSFNPEQAVFFALKKASDAGLPGIDMERVYEALNSSYRPRSS